MLSRLYLIAVAVSLPCRKREREKPRAEAAAAVDEMTDDGFGRHGVWTETLPTHIRNIDIESIKKRAGID